MYSGLQCDSLSDDREDNFWFYEPDRPVTSFETYRFFWWNIMRQQIIILAERHFILVEGALPWVPEVKVRVFSAESHSGHSSECGIPTLFKWLIYNESLDLTLSTSSEPLALWDREETCFMPNQCMGIAGHFTIPVPHLYPTYNLLLHLVSHGAKK